QAEQAEDVIANAEMPDPENEVANGQVPVEVQSLLPPAPVEEPAQDLTGRAYAEQILEERIVDVVEMSFAQIFGSDDAEGGAAEGLAGRTANGQRKGTDYVVSGNMEVKAGEGSVTVLFQKVNSADTAGNYVESTVVTSMQQLLLSTLTKEEQESVMNGENIVVRLQVTALNESNKEQNEQEMQVIAEATGQLNQTENDYGELQVGTFLDIVIEKKIGAGDWTKVPQLNDEIEIQVEVPQELVADGRTYYVMRNHNGVCTILEDKDEDPTTVTFTTGLFSTYALLYHEQEQAAAAVTAAEIIDVMPSAGGGTKVVGDSSHGCMAHYLCILTMLMAIAMCYVFRERQSMMILALAAEFIFNGMIVLFGQCILDLPFALICYAASIAAMIAIHYRDAEQEKE
ncbi:MAG: hypothetical protein K6G23_10150, partial [Lachnospiraceae bacterium]|nr:hypothetical protein [Lachnospiraceae bacterium]